MRELEPAPTPHDIDRATQSSRLVRAAVRRAAVLAALVLLAPASVAGESDLLAAVRASDLPRVRALLAAGGDPNASTPRGWTPLMEAARRGDTRMARLLLDAGAFPDARDRLEGTALDVAERGGHHILARLLRKRGARGSGKSIGDVVCVRKWAGQGFCGRVEAVEARRSLLRLTRVDGCEGGCPPDPDCSGTRGVGGPEGLRAGDALWVRSWCLTHTGRE